MTITRAEAARRRGCSRAAVTLACKGALRDACVGRGIDPEHPAYLFWLAASDGAPTSPPAKSNNKAPAGSDLGLELRRANVAKRQAEVEALKLKLARERGALISRDLVRTHVFGHLERLHQRLLQDLPMAAATRFTGTSTREERIAMLRELLGTELRAAKEAVTRSLRAITAEAPSETDADGPSPGVPREHEDASDSRRHRRDAANRRVRRDARSVQG